MFEYVTKKGQQKRVRIPPEEMLEILKRLGLSVWEGSVVFGKTYRAMQHRVRRGWALPERQAVWVRSIRAVTIRKHVFVVTVARELLKESRKPRERVRREKKRKEGWSPRARARQSQSQIRRWIRWREEKWRREQGKSKAPTGCVARGGGAELGANLRDENLGGLKPE
jgi:hypothetical protein